MEPIKLPAIFILLLVSFSAGFGQKPGAAKPDPTKPVREAFDRIVDGIKESNAEKTMSVYENSPLILFFNNNGSVTQGWAEMEKLRKESYAKSKNVTLGDDRRSDRNARPRRRLSNVQMETISGNRRKARDSVRPDDTGVQKNRKGLESGSPAYVPRQSGAGSTSITF
jgi:hypothetical protein